MKISDLKITSEVTKTPTDKDKLEVHDESGKKISFGFKKGADALYTRLEGGYGLKLVHPIRESPDKYAYESTLEMYNHMLYIKNKNLEIFPEIYDISYEEEDGKVYILMEHISDKNSKSDYAKYDWIPESDRGFLNINLKVPLTILDKYNKIILKSGLIPDTSWFKIDHNFVGDKIIDFHRFRYVPERYYFKSRGNTVDDLENLYNTFIKRYKDMSLDPPKWYRAGMYEGFRFDNGYKFKGYSSDGEEYDSYRKLNFQYLTLANNSSVLDIGSNQGFFCFQSVIHGAKKVVGIEKTLEDHQTAVDINDKIFKFDEIEFINGDAKKYVIETEEKFDMVVMNSVFHQLYPNMENDGDDRGEFMGKLRDITKYCMVFETPVNHPQMKRSLDHIKSTLSTYFKHIKIAYVYNAYSSGYRVIFICLK